MPLDSLTLGEEAPLQRLELSNALDSGFGFIDLNRV